MALGVWHVAAKFHIDVKRVYSRFGNIVSDTTVRKALHPLTGSSLSALPMAVQEATAGGETDKCLILDNVQDYCPVTYLLSPSLQPVLGLNITKRGQISCMAYLQISHMYMFVSLNCDGSHHVY